jgi:thiol:disulfide interchange protein DsbD
MKLNHMRWILAALLCLVASVVIPAPSPAENAAGAALATSEQPTSHVSARLLADGKAVVPGVPFQLGVELSMEPGWHTYYKESGEAGMPTRIEWRLPPGFAAGPLKWEPPERFNDSGIITYGYRDRTVIAAEVKPPASLSASGTLTFAARVKWLACKEACIPGGTDLRLTLPVARTGAKPEPDNTDRFSRVGFEGPLPEGDAGAASSQQFSGNILDQNLHVAGAPAAQPGLVMYLALAFVGGFILNFMPCVLPVISIKVLSFVEQAGEDARRVFQLGLAFTAGIIASFLALAGLVVAIQQAGQSVGWGFQFQHPGFLLFMSAVVLLLALSLFGLFFVPAPGGAPEIDRLAGREGMSGSFFKGVLATTLATPCTAPFLGTAVGFAFTQPAWVIVAVFLAVALGMAFPYVLLTAKPGWMKHIPRPGVWMEKFKESMGFVLLGTVIWLLWVLGKQVGVEPMMWAATFLICLAFSAWIIARFTDLTSSIARLAVVWTIAGVITAIAFYFCVWSVPGLGRAAPLVMAAQPAESQAGGIAWQRFDLPALNKALADNKTVFIDFTAEWCLTCKANEQAVINTAPVINKFKALNVVAFRADWTKQDESITRLLNKFGRSGVPLYVIFPAGKPTEPIVLPEVITQGLVLEKLDQAGPSQT